MYIYFNFFFGAIKISLNKKRNYVKRLKGAEGVISNGLHRGLERCRVYDIRNTFPLPHKFSTDKTYNHEKLLFSGRIFLNDFPCFIGWWFTQQITGKISVRCPWKGVNYNTFFCDSAKFLKNNNRGRAFILMGTCLECSRGIAWFTHLHPP